MMKGILYSKTLGLGFLGSKNKAFKSSLQHLFPNIETKFSRRAKIWTLS